MNKRIQQAIDRINYMHKNGKIQCLGNYSDKEGNVCVIGAMFSSGLLKAIREGLFMPDITQAVRAYPGLSKALPFPVEVLRDAQDINDDGKIDEAVKYLNDWAKQNG